MFRPVYNHTSYLSRAPRAVPVEKIWSCGEICPYDRWSGGVILHMTDCHVEKDSPHEKCEENLWKMWRNYVYNVWCFVAFYVILLQNLFFVIYAVLSRNMFLAIHSLLRGDKLNKNLCPWRKNDKYELCGYHFCSPRREYN